jgi:hypothetical protein
MSVPWVSFSLYFVTICAYCSWYPSERPIRPMERLVDITTSWSLDKRVNTFMLKKTNSVPFHFGVGVTPTHSGYVDWESAPGKWSKRWMELRDGSLSLSKKDNVSGHFYPAFPQIQSPLTTSTSQRRSRYAGLCPTLRST